MLRVALASIDGYISLLPNERQHEIKTALALNIFSRRDAPAAAELAASPQSLMKRAVEQVKEA